MTVDHTPKSPTSPTSAAVFPLDSALGRRRRASLAIIPSSSQTNPADTMSESRRDSMTIWSPPPPYSALSETFPVPPLDTAIAAETWRQQASPTSMDIDLTLSRSPVLVPLSSSSSITPADAQSRPADFRAAVARISTPLVPLISVTTGLAHPYFPRTLLQFYLLTHDQLDSLARWYHQVEPAVEETWMYPAWIPPFTSLLSPSPSPSPSSEGTTAVTHTYREQPSASAYTPSRGFKHVTLETKRRRWGRFIGFQGCESPSQDGDRGGDGGTLAERMERDWRNAMSRMHDVEVLREKEWRGRW